MRMQFHLVEGAILLFLELQRKRGNNVNGTNCFVMAVADDVAGMVV